MRHPGKPSEIVDRIVWRKGDRSAYPLERTWAELNGVSSSRERSSIFRKRAEATFLERHFSKAYLVALAKEVMARHPQGHLLLSEWYDAVRKDHADFLHELDQHAREEERRRVLLIEVTEWERERDAALKEPGEMRKQDTVDQQVGELSFCDACESAIDAFSGRCMCD